LAEYEGDYPKARSLYEQSLDLFRELGDHGKVAWTLHGLGFVALCQQDFARARSLLTESLILFCDSEARWGKVRALERFANLAMAQGQATRAVRLLGAADAAREIAGSPLPPSEREEQDQIIAEARSTLEENAFNMAWAEGQAMSLEQAVEYALAEETGVP
jgi:tetratricopeptide (TPR) repeat protein